MLSNRLSYSDEHPTDTTEISMEQVKINLTNGDYLTRADTRYLPPAREGNECSAVCPRFPYYRCTRDRGHGSGTKSSDGDLDHAAHGWFQGVRRLIVMYARWSQ